ncbi:MAG TPA: hypothetical protein VKD72_34990 [Gemmataceae bacterium]|nr:hypothetical protein [Gemmataceae bacterium]
MMRSVLRRGLLAAVLGLGMSGGLARAEEPAKALPLPSASTPYDGVLHQFPSSVVSEGAAPVAEEHAGYSGHHWLSFLRPSTYIDAIHSLGCYAHHNDYSCGSWHSECTFLFGSCRQFYGERCLKEPPLSPVPGYDPETMTFTPPGAPGPVSPPILDPRWSEHQQRSGGGSGSGCGCR